MDEIPIHLLLLFISILAGISWVATLALSSFCQWVWAWVDDSSPGHNLLLKAAIRPFGWVVNAPTSIWKYHKVNRKGEIIGRSDDTGSFVFVGALTCAAIPIAVYLYQITLIAVVAIFLAITARFVRRLGKKLSAHMEDTNAHKPTEE